MRVIIESLPDGKIRMTARKGFFNRKIFDRVLDVINFPIVITQAYTLLTDLEASYTLKNKMSGWLHWSLSFQHKKIGVKL